MSDIDVMSVEDRLLKLEEIWNSFDKMVIKSPKWHENVLKKREERFKNDEMDFVSISQLKKKKSEV